MYGWRARIGRLAPSASIVIDNEWEQIAPPGVVTVCSRYYIEEVTEANLESMMQQVDRAAHEVASARVDVLAQCGTPGIFLRGFGYDQEVIGRLQARAGVPVTTTATALVEGLRRLGAARLAVLTTYGPGMNDRLQGFLAASGFTVAAISGLGIARNADAGEHFPESVYRTARKAFHAADKADALVIAAGGLRTLEVVTALEEDLGVPVPTTSTATFWHAMRLAGVKAKVQGYGTLLTL